MSATADVLVVGSGAAGLTAALNLAEDRKVAVIAKGALGEGATGWAQGGIAAVLEEGDSFEAHLNETTDRWSSMSLNPRPRPFSGWSISACPSRTKAARCT